MYRSICLSVYLSFYLLLNVSNTKRSAKNKFKGDTNYKPVQEGNVFAHIAKFFAVVVMARGVHVVIENPSGSYI